MNIDWWSKLGLELIIFSKFDKYFRYTTPNLATTWYLLIQPNISPTTSAAKPPRGKSPLSPRQLRSNKREKPMRASLEIQMPRMILKSHYKLMTLNSRRTKRILQLLKLRSWMKKNPKKRRASLALSILSPCARSSGQRSRSLKTSQDTFRNAWPRSAP